MSNNTTPLEPRKRSIEDWIKDFASHGESDAYLRLFGSQIKRMRKKDCFVDPLGSTDIHGQSLCHVSWKFPTVPGSFANEMLKLTIAALQKQLRHYKKI